MLSYLLVAIGGALGSVARFWVSGLVADRIGSVFPWNTLAVNVTGSFVIGLVAVLADPEGPLRPQSRAFAVQFIMYGVCGGYTTFSSFSLATLKQLQEREWLYAGGNVILSVALCMVGVWLGWIAGQVLRQCMHR